MWTRRTPIETRLSGTAQCDRKDRRSRRAEAETRTATDEAYWQEQGRAVGDPSKISEKKKKDYGFGAPKWSPYYRSSQTKEEIKDRGGACRVGIR